MGIWAAVYRRASPQPVSADVEEALRRVLSRDDRDTPLVWRRGRASLFAVDVGVLGVADDSTPDANGPLTLCAGDPLVRDDGAPGSGADVRRLHAAWLTGDYGATRGARGVFCAVQSPADGARLTIVGDRLGVRPVYYTSQGDYVFAATALRILEALPILRKTLDVRGVLEANAFGHELGDRTPYDGIRVLGSGAVVHIEHDRIRLDRYYRLDAVAPSARPPAAHAPDVTATFRAAVRRRLGAERSAVAYLSGGLDSRAVVAELRELDVRVYAFNFAPPRTQDQVFGRQFADAVGVVHSEAPRPPGSEIQWSMLMARAWRASPHRSEAALARSDMVWSGDGGSVTLGHVGITPRIVELARARRRPDAAQAYIDDFRAAVPRRVLRPKVWRALRDACLDGMLEDLSGIACADPGRDVWAWKMMSDQRRHLKRHYEDLDLHRLEFHLPFYDGDFIDRIASVPVDECTNHRLYASMIPLLPQSMLTAPWQTYPGAVPCPVPVTQQLDYQWAGETEGRASAVRERMVLGKKSAALVFSRRFPSGILDRSVVASATVLHMLGIRDTAYALELAVAVDRHAIHSEGRFAIGVHAI